MSTRAMGQRDNEGDNEVKWRVGEVIEFNGYEIDNGYG